MREVIWREVWFIRNRVFEDRGYGHRLYDARLFDEREGYDIV